MELFTRLNRQGTTIVQVTHSEKNASYGHRTIQLRDGWVVEPERGRRPRSCSSASDVHPRRSALRAALLAAHTRIQHHRAAHIGAGIGAVTAMSSVGLAVLLRPLPVTEQDRLVLIRKEAPRDRSLRPFPHADIAGFLQRSGAVERTAGVQYDGAFPYVVSRGAEAFNLMGSLVSAEFFEVLGVRPAAGRLLDRAGCGARRPGGHRHQLRTMAAPVRRRPGDRRTAR